ncbi:MAG: hypothetical protein ABI836_07875 [Gemmatimonadota bacterium]
MPPRPPQYGPLAAFISLMVLAGCSDSSSGPANAAPVAVVGMVSGAVRGDTVVLDGTGSSDADGDTLRFTWTLVSRPVGSTAELLPPDGVSPALVADLVGSYLVSLVVSDGHTSSRPEQAAISVTIPAPVVTIDMPLDQTIVTASPAVVTGSVRDADAVTLNGIPATVDLQAGTYTATVPLNPGFNPVTALATNATGAGSTQITVILNTANTPVVVITSPKKGFLLGHTYLDTQTPQPEMVIVHGTVRVFTSEAVNTPAVTVQGVSATLIDTSFMGCPSGVPAHCFSFTATLSLPRGSHTLWAVGQDALTGRDSASVSGTSDYAIHPSDQQWTDENKTVNPVDWTPPHLAAQIQTVPAVLKQNARAHEIDGCSAPTGETYRNNPMQGSTLNRAPTAFGAGTQPPGEYLVHGQTSVSGLPCNKHDICYQTVGSSRATCDSDFYAALRAVCGKAYPPETAGYLLLHPVYKNEQSKCYTKAANYYNAVHAFGQSKFSKRQSQYTYTP